MNARRSSSLLLACAMAASAVSLGTVVSASTDHHDGASTQTTGDLSPTESAPEQAPFIQAQADMVFGTVESPRDIVVSMTDDLRFDPGAIIVAEGETIRFVLDNPTAAPHEFVIGDAEEQEHHAMEMAEGMEMSEDMHHADAPPDEAGLPGEVELEPGESVEVLATFDEAGELLIGCHVPGHWAAGMRGTIVVSPTELNPALAGAPSA